ncbi:hypothetical protein CLAIMM_13912 [Cladophialophora immunda]|nr:hypothetical protein CLAIMM_13912 [Cladophialophora immunda]
MEKQSCHEKFIEQGQPLMAEVEDATNHEHELKLLEAVRLYPKAVAWSVMMSTALVMDGYDLKVKSEPRCPCLFLTCVQLIGSLFAQPAFNEAYGELRTNGKYQISAPWQSGLNNGSNVGQIIGLMLSGYVVERIGFRFTMMIALSVVIPLIFIQFFASSLGVLAVGQVLIGIPLGMFQTVTCVYAMEVMPTCLRAYLTSYVNLCWLFGQLIASGVLRGTLQLSAPWAYRAPFAVQFFWPLPLLIGAFLAPESPWWLVRQRRIDEAKLSVKRLTSKTSVNFDLDKHVALIRATTEHERRLKDETHFATCFKSTDLRRTIIVIGCYCMQVISGSTLRAYATYFFQQAGLATNQAFNMSMVVYAIGIAGVVSSWFFMFRVGRRTLFLIGLSCLTVVYCIIGALGIAQASHPSPGQAWGIGALLLLSSYVANSTIGAVSYTLVSEMPSSLLRSKTVAIARGSYAVINIGANVITPYMLNSTAWNWQAQAGWFWGGACGLGLVFSYFVIPESKNRTVAELDLLFERKISARKFASTQISIAGLTGHRD